MENQILLEKIGETKTDKLIQDCNKIYMEKFRKEYPNYFESNYLKSIAKVLVSKPNSNEISGIGMSCMNDLMTKQFAQFLGAFLGSARFTLPDEPKNTAGTPQVWGFLKGSPDSQFFGRTTTGATGLNFNVSNSLNVPVKTDFNANLGTISRALIANSGSFSAGLNTVTWSAGNFALVDFSISSASVIPSWQLAGGGIGNYLLLYDLISPVVPVLLGESIFIEYTFQLS